MAINLINKTKVKFKVGIKGKVIFSICFASFLVVSVGLSAGYFLSFNLVQDIIAEDYRKMADLLSDNVSDKINKEVNRITKGILEEIDKVTQKLSKFNTLKKNIIKVQFENELLYLLN